MKSGKHLQQLKPTFKSSQKQSLEILDFIIPGFCLQRFKPEVMKYQYVIARFA